ncbi:MAG: ATP-binding protein [Terracidiphilus sp.]
MSSCAICGGIGLVEERTPGGVMVSRACQCQQAQREERRLVSARIPERYRDCTLDTFDTGYKGADVSLGNALTAARRFVEEYPVGTGGRGLLFVGSIGVGKTHLAVGVLRRLVRERGARGLFCDYRELLKNIQNSYNPQVNTTELELLKPIFAAEVLVLDDLGAQKPNEWVWDTVALILNTRYNDKQSTIVTTNYPDLPRGAGFKQSDDGSKPAKSEDTLGDRIGDRMLSRLAEMCVRVEMKGDDIRRSTERARFG